MVNFARGLLFGFLLLFSVKVFAASSDWYSYYIQCVASSSHEASCYDAIRDFLATDEGKKQAVEIGFKRQLFRDASQVVTQVVVISHRIEQMSNYLTVALEKAQDDKDSVRSYCLENKNRELAALRRNIEEKKSHMVQTANQALPEAVESDYQLILSLNTRANELYLQAKKCLE